MKKLIFILIVFTSLYSRSQSDTLYMLDGRKITCKIYEIGEYQMRYRIGGDNGTLFVIDKFNVRKYALANGFSEIVMPDELAVDQMHAPIINNRSVIKIHPFSLAFNHVSLAYETVIKVGMNVDVEAGYINSQINSGANGLLNFNKFHSGAYFKPGIKFFKGTDYVVRGLRYSHPLKGSYIKLDLAASYLKFENIETSYYPSNYNYTNVAPSPSVISTDISSVAYGGFVNFGHQSILGNVLTLDMYCGFGFTGQTNTYSNKNYLSTLSQYGYSYYGINENRINNYYGWSRIPGLGLSFTCGFRIGFILPAKNTGRTKVPQ